LLAVAFSLTVTEALFRVTVGGTSVTVNVNVAVPLVPSAFLAVIVTVCGPPSLSGSGGASNQVQDPLFVPSPVGVMVPSEAVSDVTLSSKSENDPLAPAVAFSGKLAGGDVITVTVGATSVTVMLTVPVRLSRALLSPSVVWMVKPKVSGPSKPAGGV
jgi:hypothetical protein